PFLSLYYFPTRRSSDLSHPGRLTSHSIFHTYLLVPVPDPTSFSPRLPILLDFFVLYSIHEFFLNKKSGYMCLIHYCMLYFFLNRSTRTPTRSAFCLPVKNGCVSELNSIRITG